MTHVLSLVSDDYGHCYRGMTLIVEGISDYVHMVTCLLIQRLLIMSLSYTIPYGCHYVSQKKKFHSIQIVVIRW